MSPTTAASAHRPNESTRLAENADTRSAWRFATLGQRMHLANRRAEQGQVSARPGHVRHVDREHPRARRPPLRQPLEGPRRVRQVAQQGVDLLCVVMALPVLGLGADREQPLDRIGPLERQVDHHERVAVGGGTPRGLGRPERRGANRRRPPADHGAGSREGGGRSRPPPSRPPPSPSRVPPGPSPRPCPGRGHRGPGRACPQAPGRRHGAGPPPRPRRHPSPRITCDRIRPAVIPSARQ